MEEDFESLRHNSKSILMDFKLGYGQIVELGQKIDEVLSSTGIHNECTLTIPLGKTEFKKVDEDLYYRSGIPESMFLPTMRLL